LVKYNRQTPCIYHHIKTVFHGIPKNASTSVKNILYEANWGKPFEGNKQWVHKGNEKGGSIYPSIDMVRSNKYDSYTHFTVVRNPYLRFISFYSDLFLGTTKIRNNTPPFYIDNNIKLKQTPVDDVIDIICTYSDDEADEHFASQSSFVYKESIHFLKMETIAEEWISICYHLNIVHKALPVYNKSSNNVYLTEDQKNRIYNRYKEDFERFKYER
jgi:hypothetical protein